MHRAGAGAALAADDHPIHDLLAPGAAAEWAARVVVVIRVVASIPVTAVVAPITASQHRWEAQIHRPQQRLHAQEAHARRHGHQLRDVAVDLGLVADGAPSHRLCQGTSAHSVRPCDSTPSASSSMACALPIRFVRSSQSRFGVAAISSSRSTRQAGSTALSNTSARLAQKTRCRRLCSNQNLSASAFHFSGLRQFDSLLRRRGAPGPQFTAVPPPKRALRVST